MSNETTENFWAAFNSWEPQAPLLPPRYRVYYDEHGTPTDLTNEDLPGNYIEIDRETFIDFPRYAKVVDGKLEILKMNVVHKLKPSTNGTPCDPRDVSVVVDTSKPHQKWILK